MLQRAMIGGGAIEAVTDREALRDLAVSLAPLGERTALARAWTALERESEPSFFLSWGWIGGWLDSLPDSIEPLLLRAERAGRTVGLGLLVSRTQWRHGFVRSRRLLLHQAGDPKLDSLFIEHNGLLTRRGDEAAVAAACLTYFDRLGRWDEIVLPGVGPAWLAAASAGPRRCAVSWQVDAPFVDLGAVRQAGGGYLAGLGKNTRHAIRRSLKLYEERGPVALRPAETATEALVFLDRLAALHEQTWKARGLPGAFAEPAFRRFHERLVETRFAAGEIQLLHATAGDTTIGYLYNFARDGRVYQYQSGLAYEESDKLKPGLVSHCLAVEAALGAGSESYDFLAGDERYKRNLANDARPLVWFSWQRDLRRFRLEEALRQAKRRWRTAPTGEAGG